MEPVMDGERARVDVADGVDEADDATGSAQVQPGERAGLAQPGEVEERVTGEHAVALGNQPVVELDLLRRRWGAGHPTHRHRDPMAATA